MLTASLSNHPETLVVVTSSERMGKLDDYTISRRELILQLVRAPLVKVSHGRKSASMYGFTQCPSKALQGEI